MSDATRISDDATTYGRRGHEWHPDFVAYMAAMVKHPAYSGMPDAVKDDGKIQWEAPSNRGPGRYQNTHHLRRDWWRSKASSVGVEPDSPNWISEVAKRLHPTGEKPCKRCGRAMLLVYSYPNGHLQRRLKKVFGEAFEVDPNEAIEDLVVRLVDVYGSTALHQLPKLLGTKDISVPELGGDLEKWLSWVRDEYVSLEPSLLSPGAMSNAPDRFDGFHSFNLCCRKKADTGRHADNLRSYTTDRRVFEYWSDGDWIAADRMMGLVRARFRNELCADGGQGPATADHIGPLSLGFAHTPDFRLLSRSANSAKNNRMTLLDVQDLLAAEADGKVVTSWHNQGLWDLRKLSVTDDETALRLSKMLRDNQRNAMSVLLDVLNAGCCCFLVELLSLKRAEYNVEFTDLHVAEFIPRYGDIVRRERTTKYACEQKARRLRVGFESLRQYAERGNRHAFVVQDERFKAEVSRALSYLEACPVDVHRLDEELRDLVFPKEGIHSEVALREISDRLPTGLPCFQHARGALASALGVVAEVISARWDDDRYVRAEFAFDDG